MKSLINLTLALSVLAGPALAFAQSSPAPVTRAQVRADLERLERAGYNPGYNDDATYPEAIQKAEAKVAAEDARTVANTPADPAAMSSVGSGMSGSSAAGSRVALPGGNTGTPAGQSCVGPVSFCSIYSGS